MSESWEKLIHWTHSDSWTDSEELILEQAQNPSWIEIRIINSNNSSSNSKNSRFVRHLALKKIGK